LNAWYLAPAGRRGSAYIRVVFAEGGRASNFRRDERHGTRGTVDHRLIAAGHRIEAQQVTGLVDRVDKLALLELRP